MNVWYVSYGSNICLDRFMCYINGDTPPGSDKKEIGCRDKTPPLASEKIELPYDLYFAKNQSKWGVGGVAFIGHEENAKSQTYGRMYLISEEQFNDVVAQENNLHEVSIPLQDVMRCGYSKIDNGWYGRIMYLGQKNGSPMFTFTSNQDLNITTFTIPPASYLKIIARGLLEIGITRNKIIEYFLTKHGIDGHFSSEELSQYIFS